MNIKILYKKLCTATNQIPKDRALWPHEWKKIYVKQYDRFEETVLPTKLISMDTSLESVLTERTSSREPIPFTVSLSELGTILYYTAGLKGPIRDSSAVNSAKLFDQTRRHYPSGGARYPLELYVGIQDHPDLATGLYHYNVINHSLTKLFSSGHYEEMIDCVTADWAKKAPIIFMTSAVFTRTTMKYSDGGLSLILIEAGHMQQNLLLVATALGRKSCVINGFNRSKIEKLYDLDDEEILLNLIPLSA
jgi:SagB-type dehydrogenase family enzyme